MNSINSSVANGLRARLNVTASAEPNVATLARGLVNAEGTILVYADNNGNLTDENGAPIGSMETKAAVRAATTTNGTLATAFDNASTVDGVTLATADRILIKNQTDATVNGIYIVQASGAPVRATDFNQWPEIPGTIVSVLEGTVNAGTSHLCSAPVDGILGTSNIAFVPFPSGAGFTEPIITDGIISGSVAFALLDTVATSITMGAAATTSVTIGNASGDLICKAGELVPDADDGTTLGKASKQFADLFLATGATIKFADTNVVVTHSSGILTIGTGTLKITTPTNDATSVVTAGGTQTLTAKTLTNPVINQAAVARTATADGLTTGTIADNGFFQHVTVTSADANHIIVLPTPTPGVTVVLNNGATGYELRSSAPSTVLINGGTGGAAVESAIPANSTVFMTCVTATAWKGFFMDADGDVAKVEAAA